MITNKWPRFISFESFSVHSFLIVYLTNYTVTSAVFLITTTAVNMSELPIHICPKKSKTLSQLYAFVQDFLVCRFVLCIYYCLFDKLYGHVGCLFIKFTVFSTD